MRVRLRYAKFGKVRFVSHRDMARVWERTLRRAELPVAYTEGFSPRPKLHFGLALSTGYESYGEYLDVDFRDTADEEGAVAVDLLPDRLTPLLPMGVTVEAAEVLRGKTDSLQQAVTSCTWSIEAHGAGGTETQRRIDTVLAADELPVTRTRKGKQVSDDIRPLIVGVSVKESGSPEGVVNEGVADEGVADEGVVNEGEAEDANSRVVLLAELGTQPRALRPRELVELIDSDLELTRVTRLHQWTTPDGAKREPLPFDATRAAPESVGAS